MAVYWYLNGVMPLSTSDQAHAQANHKPITAEIAVGSNLVDTAMELAKSVNIRNAKISRRAYRTYINGWLNGSYKQLIIMSPTTTKIALVDLGRGRPPRMENLFKFGA